MLTGALKQGKVVSQTKGDSSHEQPNPISNYQIGNQVWDLKRFWGCDATGCYNAYNLLDGYLSEEARVINCDTKAASQFEDMAYGRD